MGLYAINPHDPPAHGRADVSAHAGGIGQGDAGTGAVARSLLRDSRDIIRRLEREGFVLVSVSGSHHKFVHPTQRRRVIIAHPKRDLPSGTVRAISGIPAGRRTDGKAQWPIISPSFIRIAIAATACH
ncbi:MAG: addiction module toxin, HicA family, partial [Pseudorhodoplanes sp.]